MIYGGRDVISQSIMISLFTREMGKQREYNDNNGLNTKAADGENDGCSLQTWKQLKHYSSSSRQKI